MSLLAFLAMPWLPLQGIDAKLTELADGFVLVKTKAYSVEIPKDWTVGKQTPWGARSITPTGSARGELGVMTAGRTTSSWDQLYNTSLYFIYRQEPGKATPYRISKTASGYQSCAFEVLDGKGFAKRRFVLLKNDLGDAIALNLTIEDPKQEKQIAKIFDRMVRTAKVGS